MKKAVLGTLAFLAVAAAFGYAVGETLYRPDRLWTLGFYASLIELQLIALLLGLGMLLALGARLIRPAARPFSVAAMVCLLATLLPMVSALRRPGNVKVELAAFPRVLGDTREETNPRGPVVMYVVGDTGHAPENSLKVAHGIAARAAQQVDPVVGTWLLGDLIEDRGGMGYERAKLECLATPLRPVTDLGIPLFGILGNHDYEVGSALRMVDDPLLNMGGMNHYKRVIGDNLVSVFVVDSETLRRQPEQVVWLHDAVATDKSRWRVLMMHHPPVGSDLFHGGNKFCLGATADAIYGTPGIDAVITGHNHFYERRNPIGNTTFITAGSGSRKPKRDLPPDAGRAAGLAGANVFLEMAVDEDDLSFRAFTRDGVEVDSFQIHRDMPDEHAKRLVPVAYRDSASVEPAHPGDS